MSDIVFCPDRYFPHDWEPLKQHNGRTLGIRRGTRMPIVAQERDGIVTVLLTRGTTASFYKALRQWKHSFVAHVGVTSGVVWNTHTGEFCIFRDAFGWMPWMICRPEHASDATEFAATTDPDVQTAWMQGRAARRAWMGNFLLERDSEGIEDIFEGTERILPGEYVCACRRDFASFIDNLANSSADQGPLHLVRRCVWRHKQYTLLTDSRAEMAAELRQRIVDAADRIPDSNPCFTVSGGLDSTGILSGWCSRNPGIFDAVSLVSARHADCDESDELDVLERTFPIRLMRVNMDDAWPFSMPEMYTKFRAYGPFIAPGIESVLAMYRAVEAQTGPRTMITGYGGNFIVKVRPDALIRDLVARRCGWKLFFELAAMKRPDWRYLAVRFLANACGGQLRCIARDIAGRHHLDAQYALMHPDFRALFPAVQADPVFAMTHLQERAAIPMSWNWEYRVRSLDIVARSTSHTFYDPLFDLDVYDFCACIPPECFLFRGEYRPIYKEALEPLLPSEILHHPKCQSFDSLMHDGICLYAHDLVQSIIECAEPNGYVDIEATRAMFERYCDEYAHVGETDLLNRLWPALACLLWEQSA